MARGIRLKDLRSADLEAIGVPVDGLVAEGEGEGEAESQRQLGLLAQADPVLSLALDEVRQGLQSTLQLLDEALAVGSVKKGPPSALEE